MNTCIEKTCMWIFPVVLFEIFINKKQYKDWLTDKLANYDLDKTAQPLHMLLIIKHTLHIKATILMVKGCKRYIMLTMIKRNLADY